jgi:hypothetical protein
VEYCFLIPPRALISGAIAKRWLGASGNRRA